MRRIHIYVGLSACAATAALLAYASIDGRGLHAQDPKPPRASSAARLDHDAPNEREASRSRVQADQAPLAASIRVLDTDRRPVPNAVTWLVPGHSEGFPADSTEPTGASDERGLVHLEHSAIRSGSAQTLIVKHHLYPVRVTKTPAGWPHDEPVFDVTLSQFPAASLEQVFLLKGWDSQLHGNTSAFMSRDRFDLPISWDLIDGEAHRARVRTGVPDGSGRIVIGGLTPGRYRVKIHCPVGTAISTTRRLDRIAVPGPPVPIELAEVWAAVIQIKGDELTTSNSKIPHGLRANGALGQFALCEQTMIRRFGAQVARACFRRTQSSPAPKVTFRLLLQRTGWKSVEVPMRPMSANSTPHVVQVEPDAPSIVTGEPRIDLTSIMSGEQEQTTPRMLVLAGDGLPPEVAISVQHNARLVLPVGDYSLVPQSRAWRTRIRSTRLRIQGQGTTIAAPRCPDSWLPVTALIEAEDGRRARSGFLRVIQAGETIWKSTVRDDGRTPILVRPGALKLVFEPRADGPPRALGLVVRPDDTMVAMPAPER